MLKLIIFKEKFKPLNTVGYLIMFALFTVFTIFPDDETLPLFIVFWFILMSESLKFSFFDLTVHFSKSIGFTAFKPSAMYLNRNLKMLSISPIQFIKTNIVYTLIKLLPFWIVILVFAPSNINLPWIMFTVAMILKSFIGPLHTIIISRYREIVINENDLSRKEKKALFLSELSDINPYIKSHLFKHIYSMFNYGLFGMIAWFYMTVFSNSFQRSSNGLPIFDIYHPVWLIILTISSLIVIYYGGYLFLQERRLEHEIHRS